MKTFNTDVLIIGGGPAGASAAISILKYSKLSVSIVEVSNLENVRVGEQVSKSIFDFLDLLGIEKSDFGNDCFLPGYISNTAWGNSKISSRHSIQSTEVDSYQLNRDIFDLVMLSKAQEKGASLFLETKCILFNKNTDNWEVEINNSDLGTIIIVSKYLIDASGRQSHLSRQLGAKIFKADELIAVGAFLEFNKDKPLEHEIFLESVEDGWWYYALLPNNKILVTLYTDAKIIKEKRLSSIKNWSNALQNTVHMKHKVSGTISYEKLWVRNAFSHITDFSMIPDFIAIGDAAVSFDPISSMGIGFAISSACNGALAIIDGSKERIATYQSDLHNIYHHYLDTRVQYYQQEVRWLDSTFWNGKTKID